MNPQPRLSPSLRKVVKGLLRRTAEDPLEVRARLKSHIDSCAEGGEILIVESGMDCDGAAWKGKTFLLPASVSVFLHRQDKRFEWADGPFSWTIHKPSEAHLFSESHRDLALEAFENGHPSVLKPGDFFQ